MKATNLDRTKSAVLSMDMQASLVGAYAADQPDLLQRAALVLDHARRAGIPVLHVRVGFRPGLPEISSRNALFSRIKSSPEWQKAFVGASGEIHPGVAPDGDEVVITKHRVNAFAGTDLEQVLRAKEVDTLVLFGIATSGVVLSTALHASDADYQVVIIGDCCADADAAVHSCLLEKVLANRASVVTANEFVQLVGTPAN
jgi:nicotinamidase-related amidase